MTLITFAHGDTRLVAALSNGAVAIFDSAVLFSRGNDTLSPLHVFQASTPSPVRQLTPNPGDSPELLAVLHESNGTPGHTLVQVFDLQKLEAVVGWSCGAVSDTIPTTRKSICVLYVNSSPYLESRWPSLMVPKREAACHRLTKRRHRFLRAFFAINSKVCHTRATLCYKSQRHFGDLALQSNLSCYLCPARIDWARR